MNLYRTSLIEAGLALLLGCQMANGQAIKQTGQDPQQIERGRYVVEIRDSSVDKGAALRGLVTETGTRTVVYAGDDLGDLPAYAALKSMRAHGEAEVMLIAVASDEQRALMPRADLVVHGPEELAGWLERLADALGC